MNFQFLLLYYTNDTILRQAQEDNRQAQEDNRQAQEDNRQAQEDNRQAQEDNLTGSGRQLDFGFISPDTVMSYF